METLFAPVERATPEQIARDVACLNGNPFVEALLQTAGALMAVLNQERQVLAVNHALLDMLGVEDPGSLVGLRPGEVVGCNHAAEPPSGCGTTAYCSTCGAAVAIVGALSTDVDMERKCVLTVSHAGAALDLCLRVRARILTIGERRFVLLFMQDVTTQERLSEVQRTFLHDLRNLLMGLQGSADLLGLSDESERAELLGNVSKIATQLAAELNLQQTLAGDGHEANTGSRRPIKVVELLADVAGMVQNHNAAKDKRLEVDTPSRPLVVVSDAILLGRVLLNMVINAFEATPAGESVRMWCERHTRGTSSHVRFSVWNPSVIPPETKLRIFQRHFSTKSSWGRGVGTWSMKLIGEKLLQGKVDFRSELEEGTTFYLELPEAPAV